MPSNIDAEPHAESMGSISDMDDESNTDLDGSDPIYPPTPSNSAPLPPAPAMPAMYSSGCLMHLTPKCSLGIHMCCTKKVTQSEIQDASTVVKCTRAGCKMVWVCSLP